MTRMHPRGFSLIELVIVLLIMGIVIGFGVPLFAGYRSSQEVKLAGENITGQLRLARESAITSGTTQLIRFKAGYQSSDYHILRGSLATPKWSLPVGVTYLWASGTQDTFRLTSDGRSLDSGMIIVCDSRGVRDTVSVQRSGVILGS